MKNVPLASRILAPATRARRCAVLCLLALMAARPALGQASSPSSTPDTGFLTRYDFHLSSERLSGGGPGFSWTARFGGDLDVYDYGAGRLFLAADYEAVMSDEVRFFEPVQGNYMLEGGVTFRTPPGEFALVVHHVSRHLSDRFQELPVDWNTVGLRFERRLRAGRSRLLARLTATRVFRFRYVDYSWTGDADLGIERDLRPPLSLFARGSGHLFAVDRTIAGRGAQYGARVEAGVRVNGHRGELELYAGYERRVDAEVLGRTPVSWGLVGLRLAR